MSRQRRENHTVTRSFRISQSAAEALEEEASRENVSMSTILNKQLIIFAEYERYFRTLGLIRMSLPTLQRLMNGLSEESIALIGKESGSDTAVSVILARAGALSQENAVIYLETLSEFSGMFELSEANSNGKRTITLIHMLGTKGSIFLSNYVEAIFDASGCDPRITSGPHSVTLELIGQTVLGHTN